MAWTATTLRRRTTANSLKVCVAPLALASDGAVLINLATTDGSSDPQALVERAMAQGSNLFIGVVATGSETARIKRWLEDSALEVVGAIWSGGGRPRRGQRR